jgi:hypothetical protein
VGPPVHLVGQNVSASQSIPPDGRIELAFDRLLLPSTITRQTFVLAPENNQGAACAEPASTLAPRIAYDPVARIVTITPNCTLRADQSYKLFIAAPQNASDPNGLRAIDGALLDPTTQLIGFAVAKTGALPAQPAPPRVDFCADILPILTSKCNGGSCHGGSLPAAGLALTSPTSIAATAVSRVAQGANTGGKAGAGAPGAHLFAVDMPIVDPGSGTAGDPGHSWLMYKLLLAVPPAASSTPLQAGCDGGLGVPTNVSSAHLLPWQPLGDADRAALSSLVQGREMPFPTDPSAAPGEATEPLTIDELERVSRWIGQDRSSGSIVPATCSCP